jgi:hypothetical protein
MMWPASCSCAVGAIDTSGAIGDDAEQRHHELDAVVEHDHDIVAGFQARRR